MKNAVKLVSTSNDSLSLLVDSEGTLEINETDLRTTYTPYRLTCGIVGFVTSLSKFYFEEDNSLVLETFSGQTYVFQGLEDESTAT